MGMVLPPGPLGEQNKRILACTPTHACACTCTHTHTTDTHAHPLCLYLFPCPYLPNMWFYLWSRKQRGDADARFGILRIWFFPGFCLLIGWLVYESARATITKYSRVGGLNDKIYFLTIVEARSQRARCPTGWFLLSPLSFACVLTWPSLGLCVMF